MELTVATPDGVSLACERSGEGNPVVLLHGLTATRRYVVMGSSVLQRTGHEVIAYDARGHGRSDPAPRSDAYTYAHLAGDLLAVLDRIGVERAVLAGASMGAHTAVRLALERSDRVAGLVLITPSYEPRTRDDAALEQWDALARGLRDGGVDGFIAAYDFSRLSEKWRPTIERVIRQRVGAHEHPHAVADALEAVPRSRPFERLDDLRALGMPAVVVASRDDADPGHPLAVGELYARTVRGARLVVEPAPPPVRSPIAWQGGQLSRVIAKLAPSVA